VKKTTTHTPVKKEREETGNGGELHQRAGGTHPQLTTQQGQAISDDENSLKASSTSRPGPVLLEDFVLREKINHFDHERIP
jgi:catalase